MDLNLGNPIEFKIEIDTHSRSLDFDLMQSSILEDDKDNKYQPLDWQGSLFGGHHISGNLIFPPLSSKTKTIKITIKNDYLRIFKWEL